MARHGCVNGSLLIKMAHCESERGHPDGHRTVVEYQFPCITRVREEDEIGFSEVAAGITRGRRLRALRR
jgi:hypothetical protein